MLKKIYRNFLQSNFFFKLEQLTQLHWVQVCLILLLILILRFFPLLQGQTLYFGDNYSLMVPGKLFTAHWLGQGILPLWNPTIFAGLPWIGDVNQSVLYPSTLLFSLFDTAAALNFTLVIHTAFTFIAMYLASKKILNSHVSAIVASIVWTLSTQLTVVLNNISALQSLIWLPVIVYLALLISESLKAKFLFSLAICLQFSGGYPLYVIYSIFLAVFFSFLEKYEGQSFLEWLWHWIQTAFFTLGISAVIWLPFIEVLNSSTRIIQSSTQALVGSLHPLELIKIIIPYFFEYQAKGIRWGPGWNETPNVFVYFGWIGVLVLVYFIFVVKKQKKELRWMILLLGAMLYSLGSYLPLNPSFFIGPTRVPSTALIFVTFLGSLILGRYVFSIQVKKKYILLSLTFFLLAFLFYFLIGHSFYEFWNFVNYILQNRLLDSPFHTIEKNRLIFETISINLIVNSFLFTFCLWLLRKKRYLFFSLFLIIDLIFNTHGLMFFAPNDVYRQIDSGFTFDQRLKTDNQARSLIRNHNAPYTDLGAYSEASLVRQPFSDSYIDDQELIEFNHLKRMSQGMTPDWNMVAGVNILNGYTTLMPIKMNELWNEEALLNPSINNLPEIKTDNDLLADWSVKYYLVDHWFSRRENFSDYQLIQDKEYWGLYELPALRRFRFQGETLANQHEPEFKISLTQENFLETPNRIELNIDNSANHQYLIIADRYDSNWTATVNDQEVEITEFSHMRQIPVFSGQNHITLVYHPKLFYYGALISVVSLFTVMGGLLIEKKISSLKS